MGAGVVIWSPYLKSFSPSLSSHWGCCTLIRCAGTTSSAACLLSVDSVFLCLISGIRGFSVRCVVCSVRLERVGG